MFKFFIVHWLSTKFNIVSSSLLFSILFSVLKVILQISQLRSIASIDRKFISNKMPILYSVISRGPTVLAKNAECVGNFAEVTEQIIKNIPSNNHKLTYAHGNYLIHFINEDRIIYMCITDDEFERTRAFLFLTEIKRRFLMQYGLQAATAIAYAMNTEFSSILAYEMKHYSESTEFDTISRINGQINEMKDIMVKNIGKASFVFIYYLVIYLLFSLSHSLFLCFFFF